VDAVGSFGKKGLLDVALCGAMWRFAARRGFVSKFVVGGEEGEGVHRGGAEGAEAQRRGEDRTSNFQLPTFNFQLNARHELVLRITGGVDWPRRWLRNSLGFRGCGGGFFLDF
jgi:hypothetical protein